jgi:hypothetical protein
MWNYTRMCRAYPLTVRFQAKNNCSFNSSPWMAYSRDLNMAVARFGRVMLDAQTNSVSPPILVHCPHCMWCVQTGKWNRLSKSRVHIFCGRIQAVAYRRGGGGGRSSNPTPIFRSFAKAEPNSQFHGIYIRNNLIRIWVSFICKLSVTPD